MQASSTRVAGRSALTAGLPDDVLRHELIKYLDERWASNLRRAHSWPAAYIDVTGASTRIIFSDYFGTQRWRNALTLPPPVPLPTRFAALNRLFAFLTGIDLGDEWAVFGCVTHDKYYSFGDDLCAPGPPTYISGFPASVDPLVVLKKVRYFFERVPYDDPASPDAGDWGASKVATRG